MLFSKSVVDLRTYQIKVGDLEEEFYPLIIDVAQYKYK